MSPDSGGETLPHGEVDIDRCRLSEGDASWKKVGQLNPESAMPGVGSRWVDGRGGEVYRWLLAILA